MAKAKKIAEKSNMSDSLRQKIAQSMQGSSSSLVPPGIGDQPPLAAPPPRKEVTIPKLDDVMEEGEDRETLRQLVKQYAIVNGQKKAATKLLKPLANRIKPILSSYGMGQFICDGAPVDYFTTNRTSINKVKLLAAGVTLETIEACTDTKPSSTLRIGAEDEDE